MLTLAHNYNRQKLQIAARYDWIAPPFQLRFSYLMAPKVKKVMKSMKTNGAMDATKAVKATKASTQVG